MLYMRTSKQVTKQTDFLATHVLIGGMIFPWEAKAPYVASGYSILGGLEYNYLNDHVRCHVCGKWFAMLYSHLREIEGMDLDTYRTTFGLRNSTILKGYRQAKQRSPYPKVVRLHKAKNAGTSTRKDAAAVITKVKQLAATLDRTPTTNELRLIGLSPERVRKAGDGVTLNDAIRKMGLVPNMPGVLIGGRPSKEVTTPIREEAETKNLRSLCQAQIRTRLLVLADKLGRTPKHSELRVAGLNESVVPYTLGFATMREVFVSLGLTPNRRGKPSGGMIYRPDNTVALTGD